MILNSKSRSAMLLRFFASSALRARRAYRRPAVAPRSFFQMLALEMCAPLVPVPMTFSGPAHEEHGGDLGEVLRATWISQTLGKS